MDKLLNLIGLAKKAGKLEVGEEPVGAAARSKHARLILIASDAAENTRRRAKHFGDAGECICLEIPATKEALGKALGRTSCALLALTDIGFAEAIAKNSLRATKRTTARRRSGFLSRQPALPSAERSSSSTKKPARRQEKAAQGGTRPARARSKRKAQRRERYKASQGRCEARAHPRRARKGAPRRGKAARSKALCPRPPCEEGQGQRQERQ